MKEGKPIDWDDLHVEISQSLYAMGKQKDEDLGVPKAQLFNGKYHFNLHILY